ncbi:MAG: hypothetical protein ACYTXC_02730 [Nostoc sp.]
MAVSVFLADGGFVGGSFLAFLAGWWIPVVPSLLAFGGFAIAFTQYIAQSATEIPKTLGRYLTDQIVANILETPSGLKLGKERIKVTVIVSDLRVFSAISEQLPPE